jgi:hypothetical protein
MEDCRGLGRFHFQLKIGQAATSNERMLLKIVLDTSDGKVLRLLLQMEGAVDDSSRALHMLKFPSKIAQISWQGKEYKSIRHKKKLHVMKFRTENYANGKNSYGRLYMQFFGKRLQKLPSEIKNPFEKDCRNWMFSLGDGLTTLSPRTQRLYPDFLTATLGEFITWLYVQRTLYIVGTPYTAYCVLYTVYIVHLHCNLHCVLHTDYIVHCKLCTDNVRCVHCTLYVHSRLCTLN